MRILKKVNINTKSIAYIQLVRSILEYGAACWDPHNENQKIALDPVQKRETKFSNHSKESVWKTLGTNKGNLSARLNV